MTYLGPRTNVDQLIDWKQEYEAPAAGGASGRLPPWSWFGAVFVPRHDGLARGTDSPEAASRSKDASQESVDLPSVVRPDLTTLLANMVLSCTRREGHEPII